MPRADRMVAREQLEEVLELHAAAAHARPRSEHRVEGFGIAGVEEIDHALSAAVAPLAAADTPEPVSFESEDADGPAGVLALAIYASRLDC